MTNWAEYPGIIYSVLEKVNNEEILYLRVDRYDGFLYDDFEISKFYEEDIKHEIASNFAHEVLKEANYYNYRLFFTNKHHYLICRFFNTKEQIFEFLDYGIEEGFISFKEYNKYYKRLKED